MSQEQEVFEAARNSVRLDRRCRAERGGRPSGAPPEVVGELGSCGRRAGSLRPLFGRRAARVLRGSASVRVRRFGRFPGRLPVRRLPWRPYRCGYQWPAVPTGATTAVLVTTARAVSGYGYTAAPGRVRRARSARFTSAGTASGTSRTPPGPPQPGYRWVAVPIGAPAPASPRPSLPAAPDAAPPARPAANTTWPARRKANGTSGVRPVRPRRYGPARMEPGE